jgi:tetraprenyl-beta-curcumene synthase
VLRTHALAAIEHKRCNIEGAAFFWTLSRRRDPRLLRLLVAYEILADYLDRVNEHSAHLGIANGRQLHIALTDALAPERPTCDYYRLQAHADDGGYAHALVRTCRTVCEQLPCYERVRPLALHAATLTQVLAINHHPEPAQRDWELRRWAASELPPNGELCWFELTAAASAWLTVLALLALAAEPRCEEKHIVGVHAAYLPWISLLGTMLDSYSDIEEDARQRDHSYIAHYPTIGRACERLALLMERACCEARRLPNGQRHGVLVACMVAMYLSKASAHTAGLRPRTEDLLASSEPLVRVLLPVLRAFRAGYRQTYC